MAIKREKTIDEKQKDLRVTSLVGGIFAVIVVFYVLMMVEAYASMHPRENLLGNLQGGAMTIFKNPLYFWPIDYSLALPFGIATIVAAFEFLAYVINKLRIHHDINTLKGSATWQDPKEASERFADVDEAGKKQKKGAVPYKNAFGNMILSENLRMSLEQMGRKHNHALSTLILGTTGSGKSRFILKPNLLQMNCSFIITDPKGEILQDVGEAMRRFGYNVKVFDLISKGNCDTYNPLKYCKTEADIRKITQAFIKNTDPTGGKGGGSKDPFWDDAMSAFICACIALMTQCPTGSDIPYSQTPEVMGGTVYFPCFANIGDFSRMAGKKWDKNSGIELYGQAQLGDGKNATANASELAAVFENMRMYEAELQGCEPFEIEKPYALRVWEDFRVAPEKTSTTILMTVNTRLNPFNIKEVRDLTSSDTIGLDTFGNSKDALFVIIPATDKSLNFLVSFLYTQMFDVIYSNGTTEVAGSANVYLPNGDLVRHYSKEQVAEGIVDADIEAIKDATITRIDGDSFSGTTKVKKGKKSKKVAVKLDDSYYEIFDANGKLISRRPTKALAESYVRDLQHLVKKPGSGVRCPSHVRFLLDEFPNIGEIPEFKEKLATMRGYNISATVICQTITQLKGMYPDDYEVVDANCPQTIFLGGDENSNNEYISKKLGKATVKGYSNSVDGQKKASASYQVDARELMTPDELGKMPYEDSLILIYGENPIYDKKYDYPKHRFYRYTHDYGVDCGCGGFSVFDRGGYAGAEGYKLKLRALDTEAVPNIQTPQDEQGWREALMALNAAPTFDTAVEHQERNLEEMFKRKMFEDASVATAL